MRLPITAVIGRLLCVDRNSLLLAGFNLVAGIVTATLQAGRRGGCTSCYGAAADGSK